MVRRDATDVRLPLGGGAPAARWASPAGESPAPVGSGSEDARSVPRQSQMDSSALRTSLPHLSINAGGAPVVGVASKRKTRKRRAARCARLNSGRSVGGRLLMKSQLPGSLAQYVGAADERAIRVGSVAFGLRGIAHEHGIRSQSDPADLA